MKSDRLLAVAQRLQAIAQAGIAYRNTAYDLERYEEVRALSAELLAGLTGERPEAVERAFAFESGYPTPKMDVRVVLFRDGGDVLLVRERSDHDRWTLPGGWADVGYTPFEVAVKEAREETGLVVRAVRLLALLDKQRHPHPPQPWYVYKAFVQCEVEGGELSHDTLETSGARWFAPGEWAALELSVDRVTLSELEAVLPFATDPSRLSLCD
jgi:ADP-ribose pyrophosphatase YjhB (NUDIX family)